MWHLLICWSAEENYCGILQFPYDGFYFNDVKYLLLQMRIEVHPPNALAGLCYCITEEW